jgi:hypothetical protein
MSRPQLTYSDAMRQTIMPRVTASLSHRDGNIGNIGNIGNNVANVGDVA